MPYFTYILKSLSDHGFYYGHAADIDNRLKTHNQKKVRSTKSRAPFILHYFEIFQSRSEAYRQELFSKSSEGKNT